MQAFMDWVKQPFNENMSAFRWFLFFGLIIVIMVFWKLILGEIENATA